MSRVVFATHMTRYPLGGNLSWALQHILGLLRAGCEVTVVERADYPDACFDPAAHVVSNDASAGLRIVRDLLKRYGLEDRYVFVDYHNCYHGMEASVVKQRFAEADCFIDSGNHGAWRELAEGVACRVLIDGEPGYTQIRYVTDPKRAALAEQYTHHYTNGLLVGTDKTRAPDTGHRWMAFVNPVCPDLFEHVPQPCPDAAWTTIMNWRAHKPLEYLGKTYGQKDMSFLEFESLPTLTDSPIEVAVSGDAPIDRLTKLGWRIAKAQAQTQTIDRYYGYIERSMGEFSVAKHVFVAARTGWFSDRSAAYLASGRPVILQDTGFSEVLPTGEGLFAVKSPEQAMHAIDRVRSDYRRHSDAARAIAREYLDARTGFARLLAQCLSSSPF